MRWIAGTGTDGPPQFLLSRWLFLRLLGVVYLIAFASLGTQIVALVGSDGLLPIGAYLERVYEVYGAEGYVLLPTLAWISASDAFLQILCWGGVALSAVALAGIAPTLTFALLWVVYLSLTVAGQTFLSFQWDVLLLETGLLAVLYAPLGWWPRGSTEARPVALVRWLIWGLAFKLTFLSGVTKLVSTDETWADWTALTYHYWTQPIPAWTSWYVHHAPDWLHSASVGGMFFVELIVPFAILVPPRFRRLRIIAFGLLCLLQVGIGATGNYGFFGLLTVVLYLTMLDDAVVGRFLPRRLTSRSNGADQTERAREPRPWRLGVGAVALLIAVMSAATLWQEATYTRPHPIADTLLAWVSPTRSINGYGLFRTMTTERPEIIVEGSRDGETWVEYAFRWKPGELARRPPFVQPHMPRLDWQMWFAALDPRQHAHWLTPLLYALLEGSPPVLALLDDNPFPDGRPRHVRLSLYQYQFTTPDEGAVSGDWWRREFVGYLTEAVSLNGR